MTEIALPGCYGSAIFYRVGAPECEACQVRQACIPRVKDAMRGAMKEVCAYEIKFGTGTAQEIASWWKDRFTAPKVSDELPKRAAEVLETWKRDGINVYFLQVRRNPLEEVKGDPLLKEAFDFILTEGPFKPRDLIEHLRDKYPETTKVLCTRLTTDICMALQAASILKKEGRGILCLSK